MICKDQNNEPKKEYLVLHLLIHRDIWTQENEREMDVDTATSAVQTPGKHPLPEVEIYCYLLVLIFLIDQKRYDEVSSFS